MKFCAVLLLCLPASAAAREGKAATGSPVEKVVHLLEELRERIKGDGVEELQIYNKYACWCEKTSKRKAGEILEGQMELRVLGQEILRLKALIAQRTAEIEELIKNIKGEQEAIKEATAIREKENAEYMEKSTELMQALNALERAIIVLHKATSESSLVQGSATDRAAYEHAVAGVKAAITSMPASVSLPQADDVIAFLDRTSRSGGRYAPQSATVQGMLKDMYDTMAEDLEDMNKVEAKNNADFEAVVAAKLELLHEYKAEVEKKYKEKAEAETALAEAQQAYDDTMEELNADIKFFDEVKAQCEAKHAEWETRKGDREMELEGIDEALKILTSDDARELFGKAIKPGMEPTFLQVGSVEASAGRKAYLALKASATKAHSLRLADLAATLRTADVGHFDKVIKAIDEMIDVLKQEEADDIKKRDQCKDEYTKIASTVADLKWKIENNLAKIDKLEALIKEREDEKIATIEQIEETKKQIIEMEDQRKEENQLFLQAKSDDEGAIELLEQAKAALSKFYEKNKIELGRIQEGVKDVLLQEAEPNLDHLGTPNSGPAFQVHEDQAPDATFSHKGHRKNEGKGIISIITMIVEDLHAEIRTGMEAEAAAQLAFEKALAAAKKLQADLEQKVVNLDEVIAQRKDELNTEHEIMASNQGDLDDELAYQKEIKPDCDWIINAFEERREKRKAEMEGLVTAKEYLAGAAPPAMLQEKAKGFNDNTFGEIHFQGLAFLQRRQ